MEVKEKPEFLDRLQQVLTAICVCSFTIFGIVYLTSGLWERRTVEVILGISGLVGGVSVVIMITTPVLMAIVCLFHTFFAWLWHRFGNAFKRTGKASLYGLDLVLQPIIYIGVAVAVLGVIGMIIGGYLIAILLVADIVTSEAYHLLEKGNKILDSVFIYAAYAAFTLVIIVPTYALHEQLQKLKKMNGKTVQAQDEN